MDMKCFYFGMIGVGILALFIPANIAFLFYVALMVLAFIDVSIIVRKRNKDLMDSLKEYKKTLNKKEE